MCLRPVARVPRSRNESQATRHHRHSLPRQTLLYTCYYYYYCYYRTGYTTTRSSLCRGEGSAVIVSTTWRDGPESRSRNRFTKRAPPPPPPRLCGLKFPSAVQLMERDERRSRRLRSTTTTQTVIHQRRTIDGRMYSVVCTSCGHRLRYRSVRVHTRAYGTIIDARTK